MCYMWNSVIGKKETSLKNYKLQSIIGMLPLVVGPFERDLLIHQFMFLAHDNVICRSVSDSIAFFLSKSLSARSNTLRNESSQPKIPFISFSFYADSVLFVRVGTTNCKEADKEKTCREFFL